MGWPSCHTHRRRFDPHAPRKGFVPTVSYPANLCLKAGANAACTRSGQATQYLMERRTSLDDAKATALKLVAYCRANDWSGYDPYDALNSRVFTALPFLNSRLPRLVLTQVLKRSPVNIRRLALTPKTQNPKAIALFLMAFLKLSKLGTPSQEDLVGLIIERLIALRSRDPAYWCWGHTFAWQPRTTVVPRGAPNLV